MGPTAGGLITGGPTVGGPTAENPTAGGPTAGSSAIAAPGPDAAARGGSPRLILTLVLAAAALLFALLAYDLTRRIREERRRAGERK